MGVSFVFCHRGLISQLIHQFISLLGRCGCTQRLGTDHSRRSDISQWNAGDVSHHSGEYDFDGGGGDCCAMWRRKAHKATLHAGA
jgi:hypothetical protein